MNTIKIISVVLFIGILMSQIDSHSVPLPPEVRKRLLEAKKTNDLGDIESYHIHFVYQWEDRVLRSKVEDLFNKFVAHFQLETVQPCAHVYNDNQRLCPFGFHDRYVNQYPFIAGEVAFMIPLDRYSETLRWVIENRGDVDILIHPNTPDELTDHTLKTAFSGTWWPLNPSIFPLRDPFF